MPNEGKQEEARSKQSAADKASSLDLLKNKRRATKDFSVFVTDDEGEQVEVKLSYQAIGARDYDKLVAKHPPKADEAAEGAMFHLDTFAPALISACAVEPEISVADAREIWNSPDWSRGDLMVLFREAVDLNNRGMNIPFNASA